MKQKTGQLNYVFWVICILAIVRNISTIVKSLVRLFTPDSFNYMGQSVMISDHSFSLCTLLSSIFIIITIIVTLNKRKIGVWGFFVVQFVFATIFIVFFNVPTNTSYGLALINCLVFFFLLFIKRNGISSWNVIFNDEDEIDDDEIGTFSDTEDFSNNEKKEIFQDKRIDEPENLIEHKNTDNTAKEAKFEDISIQKSNIVEDQKDHQRKYSESIEVSESTNNYKLKRKHIKLATIIFVSLVLLIGICFGLWTAYDNAKPANQYEKANKLFSQGKIKEAIDIYTKLVNDKDYIPAKTRLGELYTMNDSVTPNYELGIKYLTENASIDTIALATLLAIYIPSSDLCEGKFANEEKAEHYAKLVINQGHYLKQAYFVLGNIEADRENYQLAFYYWKKSSKYNCPEAYDNLGWMYFNGYGVNVNIIKAKYYFEKALKISPDDDFALYYLGLIYENGYGVTKDVDRGIKLLKKSADLGNDNAKEEVARILMN